ncbi:protein adenylyltransferase SelO family protein [Paraurantiacibacter namhicola]|uniref:Protein adenylyltransferase SelO n=1 Tax=Paraurantiacibacter namhicola TaxID=645517 RepID=A0A1C7DA43_9SPHN|nr:YdiU family protein [Paraurantiacibacter namhicola]ANU08356.1 hypothetical protein A6F65_02069 [Paraurantiacibacter namhicola]
MRPEPQAADYRPDTPIQAIADWLADPVEAADFPQAIPRFRNSRHDKTVGLDGLDEAAWLAHFARFEPLEGNLPRPLALRYHGHQFRVYNPDIGDGRGFLFAQLRDAGGRLLDLGTKGSGTTPYSRTADGRLTLRGAIREILATEMLEALGANTSKTFAVIETGEVLERHDEPPPVRSAVMTRLSHGHIRIGSFQRLADLGERENLAALVNYCLEHYPGPEAPADAPEGDVPAVKLLHQVVERLADLAASYMAAGFVHGVLNTDNMNITGESFDYGPWRFLPQWDPGFTAAYFDHSGLYAFGRQPEAIHWNCAQLAIALRPLVEAPPLVAAIERFPALYGAALARRWCWRLGVESRGAAQDAALVSACERAIKAGALAPHELFHRHRFGAHAEGELAEALEGRESVGPQSEYWQAAEPEGLEIGEVNDVLDACCLRDDWDVLDRKVSAIRALGNALGPAPEPSGHANRLRK